MEEFLNTIYSYEYFGFYLLISIVLLVVLFLIILFFGKKDQKNREIEATKKLQQINEDTFKEDSIEEKVEVNNFEENKLENTIVVPKIDEVPTLNYIEDTEEIPEPVLPIIEDKFEEKVMDNHEIYEPILEKVEEKPLAIDNTNVFNNDFVNEVNDFQVETSKLDFHKTNEKKTEEVEVPVFNLDDIMKDVGDVKLVERYINREPIFSSVYVPEKEEIKEEKLEIPVEKAMDDLEFDLPTLRKDEKEETNVDEIDVPILKDYNLDELSGETYNINK